MATQSSPVITDMKVIPVAGHDSMLLNIGGAHNAYFTRNIVVLTDNAGHTGIGEAPGGDVIYQTLVDAIPMVLGQEVARLNKVVQQVHKGNQAADFDTFGKGAWTFELRVNAVAALEAALLDLLGKALNVPVCELLGPGKQREAITVLGYLFYIGDRTKTDLPYVENTPGNHEWYQLRHQKAMNSEAVVRLAEASQDRYGFKDFKLKGGVLPGEQEIDTVRALKKRFPDARITVDPNGAWLLDEAISLCKGLNDVLTYAEDRSLVAGCWTVLVQNASTSGRSLSGRCLPCCKASSISLVDSALSLPCLRCASWSGLLKRHLSPATVALLRPGFRRRKGERRCRFLTPLNTSQR